MIALLVVLPASELATALPWSGGGYYFVSRSLGTSFGAVIGIGLWLGLIFASAFYLIGLGHYATAVLDELGIGVSTSPVVPIGVVFGVVLMGVSIAGTENTAKSRTSSWVSAWIDSCKWSLGYLSKWMCH